MDQDSSVEHSLTLTKPWSMMNPSRSRSTSNSSERKWSEDVKPSVTLSHVVHPSCRSLSRPGDTTLTYRGNKFVRPLAALQRIRVKQSSRLEDSQVHQFLSRHRSHSPSWSALHVEVMQVPYLQHPQEFHLTSNLHTAYSIVQRTPVRDNPLRPLLPLPFSSRKQRQKLTSIFACL